MFEDVCMIGNSFKLCQSPNPEMNVLCEIFRRHERRVDETEEPGTRSSV